jgi:hypothetical protein
VSYIREVSGKLEEEFVKAAIPFTGAVTTARRPTVDDRLGFKLNLCAVLLDRLGKRVALLSDAVGAHLLAGLEVFARGKRAGGLRHDDPEVVRLSEGAAVAAYAASKLVSDVKRDVTRLAELRCVDERHAAVLRRAAEALTASKSALSLLNNNRALLRATADAVSTFLRDADGLSRELGSSQSWLARKLAAYYQGYWRGRLEGTAREVAERLEPGHAGRGPADFLEKLRSSVVLA